MRLHTSHQQARATRLHFQFQDKTDVWVNTYIGTNVAGRHAAGLTDETWEPDSPGLYPMAFLVEQTPNSTTAAHFHRSDQFQLFVGGDGEIEGKTVHPVTLHFAAAYSAYGPIVAGPDGVNYFTLRNGWDPGARWMPDNRSELRQAGRQHRTLVVEPWANASATSLAALSKVETATLISPESDGLAAWSIRVPPGSRYQGADPATGAGQYWLILDGGCVAGEARLARYSCLFLSPDESPLSIQSEREGVALIVMQYPHHA